MNESKGFRRAGLVLSLVWLALCIFPLWWVLITAFKLPIAVSGGTPISARAFASQDRIRVFSLRHLATKS